MPRTDMHESDVSDLAAHLMDYQHSDGTGAQGIAPFKADKALAAKGKAIVTAQRCASCHELPKDVAAAPVALKAGRVGVSIF